MPSELRSGPATVSVVIGAVCMEEADVCARGGSEDEGIAFVKVDGERVGPGRDPGGWEAVIAGRFGLGEGPSMAAVTVDEARPQVRKATSFRNMLRS